MSKHKWKRQGTPSRGLLRYGGESTYLCLTCGLKLQVSYACLPQSACPKESEVSNDE